MHLSDFSKRDDDNDGPSPVDRLNSLEPGARAGVITAIVIGTILIIALSTWWCCWPCCCFSWWKKNKKNPDRFENHNLKDLDAVEAGHHESNQNDPGWTNPPETTQNGFAPHERHVELEAPKDPSEPPPAYHEIK
ncbi:hypothetical protein F5X68DRAFT_260374 [Plectosphaerella plurivora]|uniref:Uncharacterized protein n=1 Tax=Plectosphaerella plurivora TaxID=936078 RepID=A0A9P8VH03_9PEZI|nr:hypothetical protein F5X68DRAFT_260374 [Plectosphaerella plurivora]